MGLVSLLLDALGGWPRAWGNKLGVTQTQMLVTEPWHFRRHP